MYQCLSPFHGQIIFHYTKTHILFVHSLVDGHMGCFYFGAMGIKAAVNTCTSFGVDAWAHTLISLRMFFGVGLLLGTLSPAQHKGTSFSTFSPTPVTVCLPVNEGHLAVARTCLSLVTKDAEQLSCVSTCRHISVSLLLSPLPGLPVQLPPEMAAALPPHPSRLSTYTALDGY